MTSAPINIMPQDGAGKGGATHALEFNLVKCTRVGNLTPRVKKILTQPPSWKVEGTWE